jgi:zinc protease
MTHPYAIPVIGWRAETEKLTTADALDFYRAHYGPDNAVLVLAGDVTEQSARPLVEKYFGPLESRHIPPRHRPAMPPQYVARQIVMHDARVKQPMWQRVYLAPSYRTAKEPGTAEALDLLEEILGTGPTSRLYRTLVVEKGVATAASADYLGTAFDDTRFVIGVIPRPGVTPEAAGEAAEAVIAQLLAKGVSADELKLAKDRLIAGELYRQDNQESRAMRFGAALATGQTVDDVVQWPERIEAVTREQVLKAAQAVLRPERSVTGILLSAPAS